MGLKFYEIGTDNNAVTIVYDVDNDKCYYLPSINNGGGIDNFSPVDAQNSIAGIKCANIVAANADPEQVALAQSILDEIES